MALRLDVLSGEGSLLLREQLEVAVREAVAERMGRDTASSLVLYMERDRMSRTIRFHVGTRDGGHAGVVVTEEYFFGIVDRYDLAREARNLAAELATHLSYLRPPELVSVLHSMPEDRGPLAAGLAAASADILRGAAALPRPGAVPEPDKDVRKPLAGRLMRFRSRNENKESGK